MPVIQALILGIVQGLTEFLPVSSSGHLIIFPNLFGWVEQPLVFDTTLHLGTAAALLAFFWKDLLSIASLLVADIKTNKTQIKKYSSLSMVGLAIVAGTIPAGVIGIFFEGALENTFRDVMSVVIFLIAGSILMLLAEFFSSPKSISVNTPVSNSVSNSVNNSVNNSVGIRNGFIIGLFQVLALLPGVSRSGSTIAGGMLIGLSREAAAKFSFLLSVPIVVLAAFYQLFTSAGEISGGLEVPLIIGFFASFLSGLAAIGFLLNFVKKRSLYLFIFYRLLLVLFLIIVL